MEQVEAAIGALRSNFLRAQVRRGDAIKRLDSIDNTIKSLSLEEEISDMSSELIRKLIDSEVTEGVQAVEELLTEGLKSVFTDQDLSVRSVVDVQYGKVSVEFVTVQKHPDGTVTEALSTDAYGGAVTTVQSVLLRVLVSLRRGLRPVLFLDETLPAFDSVYVYNMGLFLRSICERLGYDMLLISHNPAMVDAAHQSYTVHNVGGKASFKIIRGRHAVRERSTSETKAG